MTTTTTATTTTTSNTSTTTTWGHRGDPVRGPHKKIRSVLSSKAEKGATV